MMAMAMQWLVLLPLLASSDQGKAGVQLTPPLLVARLSYNTSV